MVASKATRQAMWILSLFEIIGVPQMKSIVIYDNNQNAYLYQRTKSFMFTQSISKFNIIWCKIRLKKVLLNKLRLANQK
jgi:hypothetical protein